MNSSFYSSLTYLVCLWVFSQNCTTEKEKPYLWDEMLRNDLGHTQQEPHLSICTLHTQRLSGIYMRVGTLTACRINKTLFRQPPWIFWVYLKLQCILRQINYVLLITIYHMHTINLRALSKILRRVKGSVSELIQNQINSERSTLRYSVFSQ